MKSASAAWRRRIVAGILLLLVALWLLDRLFPPPLPSGNDGFIVLARDGSPLRAWPGSDPGPNRISACRRWATGRRSLKPRPWWAAMAISPR